MQCNILALLMQQTCLRICMLIELFHDFARKLQVDQNMLQFLQKKEYVLL